MAHYLRLSWHSGPECPPEAINPKPDGLVAKAFQPVGLHRPEAGATHHEVSLPCPPALRLSTLIHRLPLFSAWQRPYFCRIVAGSHDKIPRIPDQSPSRSQPPPGPRTPRRPRRSLVRPALPIPGPVEIQEGLHTRFARLFFGVITLLVLYYSYLIIKPYLLDIFMALVLFFTAKPLYHGPHPPAAGL